MCTTYLIYWFSKLQTQNSHFLTCLADFNTSIKLSEIFIRRWRLWDAEAVDGHERSNAQQQKRDAAVDPLPEGLDLLFTWHLHIVRLLKHPRCILYPDAMSRNFWTHIYVYVYICIYILYHYYHYIIYILLYKYIWIHLIFWLRWTPVNPSAVFSLLRLCHPWTCYLARVTQASSNWAVPAVAISSF